MFEYPYLNFIEYLSLSWQQAGKKQHPFSFGLRDEHTSVKEN